MDAGFDLLKQLVPLIEEFSEDAEVALSPKDFADWLMLRLASEDQPAERIITGQFDLPTLIRSFDNKAQLGIFVHRMNKYSKSYTKEAFKHLPLNGADDFSIMASILYAGDLSKSEVLKANVSEISGGMDQLNRLIKLNLLEEFDSEEDKRSKKLRITEKGRGVFFAAVQGLNKVGEIVKAHLSPGEIRSLLYLLGKLDHFHRTIYDNEKDYDLDRLIEQYVK